jgi:hypothetical protein
MSQSTERPAEKQPEQPLPTRGVVAGISSAIGGQIVKEALEEGKQLTIPSLDGTSKEHTQERPKG